MKAKDTIFRYLLAIAISLGFFGFLVALIKFALPNENKDLLYIVAGALISSFNTIVNYEWGSSRSSALKDDKLRPPETPPQP